MKAILNTILLLIPMLCFGQQVCVYNDYLILENDTINRVSNDLKEGNWIHFEVAMESFNCFTTEKCHYQKHIRCITSEGSYINGKKTGTWNYFYTSGELQRKEVFTTEGKNDFSTVEYFKNGNVKGIQKWNKDNIDGRKSYSIIEYFENGKLNSEQKWSNGHMIEQIVYFTNGQKKFHTKTIENSISNFEIFYKSGNLKYKGTNGKDWTIVNFLSLDNNGNTIEIRPLKFGELLSREGLSNYL